MFLLRVCLLAVIFIKLACGIQPPPPFDDHCLVGKVNVYNASKAKEVPWFTIDLDKPPEQRWVEIGQKYKTGIQEAVGVIKDLTHPLFNGTLIDWVNNNMDKWVDKMPSDHKAEIQSLATASEMPLGEMVLFNIFYEFAAACTSIVANDDSGKMYHARNMDFGTFFGWNSTIRQWKLGEKLRNLLINAHWVKNGTESFRTVGFAGFTGVFNGIKPGKFSISLDTRHQLIGGYFGLIKWLLGLAPNSQFSTWHLRDTLIQASTYEQAKKALSEKPLLAPCYYILGGPKKEQAAVIVRSMKNATVYPKNDQFFILETNYDPDKETLYLDDRRTPGRACMNILGSKGVSNQGLMNVLSSKTTLNKATVFTTIMQIESGKVETFVQRCKDPCWPF